jgi:site-specific DNA-adenine methylase
MSKESREVAKYLKGNPHLLKRKKTTSYEIIETSMESFVYVDPSPPYLINTTPKHFTKKVQHLWVIK